MFSRAIQPSTKNQKVSRTFRFPAPRRGWIRNENLAQGKAEGAEVLDNFFPTTEGCRLRRGKAKHATCDGGEAVTAFLPYDVAGLEKLFAADANAIYDVTSPADPTAEITPVISGQTSGEWANTTFSTTGGKYLIAVNGSDPMQRYNGSGWTTVTSDITGVSTADLSHVWQWKQQLFFIEGGTMTAWSLPALAIIGAAVEINLGPVFKLGGELVFGATWSVSDAGDGLDDVCIFITSQGEVAVYKGTDPSSADTWALSGVYRLGKPLGKNAFVRVGGEILVVTDDGIVPVSQAVSKDKVALKLQSISYPIEEIWRTVVRESENTSVPFSIALWPAENMLAVGVPLNQFSERFMLVANARTGAWSRYTNWEARCLVVFGNSLYFGSSDGCVYQGEATGLDDETPYTGVIVPRFSDFGNPNQKVALHARVHARSNRNTNPLLSVCTDYDATVPSAPSIAANDPGASVWNDAVWNESTWGSTAYGPKASKTEWQSVNGVATAMALALQVTSGRIAAPDIEIVATDLVYEVGDVIA